MFANADDIRLYNSLIERTKQLDLVISLVGAAFQITTKCGAVLGTVSCLNDLANYLYGYDAGFSKGKNLKHKNKKQKP